MLSQTPESPAVISKPAEETYLPLIATGESTQVLTPKIASTPGKRPRTFPVAWSELMERSGAYYLKGKKKPFTGTAILVAPNGERQWTVVFKDGILGAMTDHPAQSNLSKNRKQP